MWYIYLEGCDAERSFELTRSRKTSQSCDLKFLEVHSRQPSRRFLINNSRITMQAVVLTVTVEKHQDGGGECVQHHVRAGDYTPLLVINFNVFMDCDSEQ